MKSQVIVSFFSSLSDAQIIHGDAPFLPRRPIWKNITETMRAQERIACYRDTSGAVVALDRYGDCLTV